MSPRTDSNVLEAEPEHPTGVQSVPPVEHELGSVHLACHRGPVRPDDFRPFGEQYQRMGANSPPPPPFPQRQTFKWEQACGRREL